MGEIVSLQDGVYKYELPPLPRETGSHFYVKYWENLDIKNIAYPDSFGGWGIEKWLPVVGYEGIYEVSNLGRVKGLARVSSKNKKGSYRNIEEKIRPSFDDGKGYRRIELSKNGVNRKYFVHKLVAMAFIPNPENKADVNHLLGNKSDNRSWMIEWATKSENRRHAIDVLGVRIASPWKGCRPEGHPMFGRKGVLAPKSRPVFCKENGKTYASIKDAASDLGIPQTTLNYILHGRTKKSKTSYTFSFVNG